MNSAFGVRIASSARRRLGRLPARVATADVEFITAVLPENRLRLSEPLTGEFDGLRSARRGDYRVLI